MLGINRTIHIILFSRLQSFDGGRETWLNNFLIESWKIDSKINFLVYYYSDSNSKTDQLIQAVNLNPNCFKNVNIISGGNLSRSLIRVLGFQMKVYKEIKRRIQNDDVILGVGNIHESFVPFLFTRLFHFKKRYFPGIWLRSIFVKQQAALASSWRLKWMEAIEVYFLKSVSFILSNGWDTSNFYFKKYGIKSHVIPNSLSLNKFHSIKPINIVSDVLVVSYIGRLSIEKGFIQFIESIKYFNSNFSELQSKIRFEVVGDGPLCTILNELNFDNVLYKGVLSNNDIPNYLDSIDCGVALTLSESVGGGGLSHGFLELLVSGRIAIVWDNPIFNQIDCSEATVMIEEGNSNKLGEMYKQIILNKYSFIQRSNNAARLGQSFSIENHVLNFNTFVNNL
jgi:glycosyltransferase involved in cell wall biosynthesis